MTGNLRPFSLCLIFGFFLLGCDDSGTTKSDPCLGINCSGNGVCVVQYDAAVCSCFFGYHPDGLSCVRDPQPCDDVPCSGHGTCVDDGEGDLSCDCDDGYIAQDLECISETSACLGVLCSGHGTCVEDGEGVGSCDCDEGYAAVDLECRAINQNCGNGAIDAGEECDGTNLNGETCSTVFWNRPSGTLACSETCVFDGSGCTLPECGNNLREGSEECDGTDLGGTVCTDIAGFDGGVLGCTEGCTYDTDECTIDCVVEANFETCNPMGGVNECCPNNGMPSTCFSSGSFQACMQTCSTHAECGWSMDCLSSIGGLCYVDFCGLGTGSTTALQSPCTLEGGRSGVCYPLWRAMDDGGMCLQNGTAVHGAVCSLDDSLGELGVDPATQCNNGFCFGETGAPQGVCYQKCNPVTTYSSKTDSCPAGSYCVNFSSIDLDTASSNYLFREADLGACYVTTEFQTCDLLTGLTLKGNTQCPVGKTCNYFGLGSLLGFCYDVAAAPKTQGTSCSIVNGAPQECAAGLQCFISDPFSDSSALACRKICDANTFSGNTACAGLVDGINRPYVCLSTSRFFTSDHELPTVGTGLNMETETSPSRLGFCVPQPPM